MTSFQKFIKYCAIALAAVIIVSIVGGAAWGISAIVGLADGELAGAVLDSGVQIGKYEEVDGDMNGYSVSGDITAVRIDVSAARISVRTGDALSVESTISDLTVKNDGGRLVIKDKKHIIYNNSNKNTVDIILPEGITLDELDIDGGAGTLDVSGITSRRLSVDIGAGSTRLSSLTVTESADIDGGAGRLVIDGCDITDLDFDMGTGKAVLDCRLSGDCSIDQGVGALELTLRGTPNDYRIKLDKGIGSARLGGSGVGDGTYGSGACTVDLDGGIGSMIIDFAED